MKKGVYTPWELADVFEVSYEYMRKALEHYRTAEVDIEGQLHG